MSETLRFNVEGKQLDQPVSFYDITYKDLTSVDYVASDTGKGVYFKGDTAGKYRCITLTQYNKAGGTSTDTDAVRDALILVIVAAANYVDLYLAAHQWADSPVVFIETTGAAGTNLNIGHY